MKPQCKTAVERSVTLADDMQELCQAMFCESIWELALHKPQEGAANARLKRQKLR